MAQKKKQGKFQSKKSVNTHAEAAPSENVKKSSKAVLTTLVTLCACISLLASVFFLDKLGVTIVLPGRTIAAGVSVAGVDVGGLKRREAVEAVTAAIGDSYSTESMVVTVLEQQLEISPADSGASFDVNGAVREAFKYGTQDNTQLQVDIVPYLELNTEAIQKKISALAELFPTDGISTGNQIIQETVDGVEQDVLEVTVGTVYYDFSADALYDVILNAYNDHQFHANYSCNRFEADTVDLDALYEAYCIDAVDATLDPETHEVTQSAPGTRFDLDSAREALAAAQPGDVLKLPFVEVLPEMDTETLKSMLFRDVIGSFTAYQGSSYNRANNLRLACESLDGIILYPGDVFDYNAALGERTAERGYLPADAYMGSKTVQSYGGGICQPSSCLYYSALIADLEIVERSCHGFVSSYMPYGMDATVSWGGPEFKFKNNTDFPIRIDAKADGGTVTIELVGTDVKDYYVKMDYEILSVDYPSVKEIETKDKSKDGKVETTAYTGYTVQTYKLKYDKETDELISRQKEAYSVYSRRDKEVYVYKEKETTPPTEAPTNPPATESTAPAPTAPPSTEAPAPEPEPTPEPTTEPTPTPSTPTVGEAGSDVQLPDE